MMRGLDFGARDYGSDFYAVRWARGAPGFAALALDALGRGALNDHSVIEETDPPAAALRWRAIAPDTFVYEFENGAPAWRMECDPAGFTLRSEFTPGAVVPPLTLHFRQKTCYATLLGRMAEDGRRAIRLPAVLHLPNRGSLRIEGDPVGRDMDYDARRKVPEPFVRIAFPGADAARPRVGYRFTVTAIHPALPAGADDPIYDGFRLNYLNMFQVNPRLRVLANNSSSDACAFTLYEYADMARPLPPLAVGLSMMDLLRDTLDRYLAGQTGYGQLGYPNAQDYRDGEPHGWQAPANSLDSMPSLVISAVVYADATGDDAWARARYDGIAAWAREMAAGDRDGNGLIEYAAPGLFGDRPRGDRRPANWWDTINFGHEDAYSNALAYRAAREFAALAQRLGHAADAAFFTAFADRLRAAYAPAFFNPETGLLAGWRDTTGRLHDYRFTFIQGVAVAFGLVEDDLAHRLFDALWRHLRAAGFDRFDLGLPGNLIPVPKGDYVFHGTAPKYGEPALDDGSDGFQKYCNGGASGNFVYFTLRALRQLGRLDEAQRIFIPMLRGYAEGGFEGVDPDTGQTFDWRDWSGRGWGYEGLLVDNYLPLLEVPEFAAARLRAGHSYSC